MFELPRHVVAHATRTGDAVTLEYRLTSADVAALLGVSQPTIWRWTKRSRKGLKLRSRTFHASDPHPRHAYRLAEVEDFAAGAGLSVRYDFLHPALQREYRVGPFGDIHWITKT